MVMQGNDRGAMRGNVGRYGCEVRACPFDDGALQDISTKLVMVSAGQLRSALWFRVNNEIARRWVIGDRDPVLEQCCVEAKRRGRESVALLWWSKMDEKWHFLSWCLVEHFELLK